MSAQDGTALVLRSQPHLRSSCLDGMKRRLGSGRAVSGCCIGSLVKKSSYGSYGFTLTCDMAAVLHVKAAA